MASDVLRYLNKEPVLAHAASTSYRLKKYAQRHRAGVAAAAALVPPAAGFRHHGILASPAYHTGTRSRQPNY